MNNLYIKINQYSLELKNNQALEERLKEIKDDFFDQFDKEVVFTKTERKLLMLLKLGLSSKEIALVLNVSSETVDQYRYRVRKKNENEKKCFV